MITFIKGEVIKVSVTTKNSSVDILTSSGVGYRIVTAESNPKLLVGDQHSFFTSFQVREDSQTLYGFDSEAQRDFFEEMISVSGIGPKIGLSILSTFKLDQLKQLIYEGDYKQLSSTPGLGLKGAQKIIVEIQGKIDFNRVDELSEDIEKELKAVLKKLGFKGDELEQMLEIGNGILKVEKGIILEELLQKVLRESK
jgi:Holliday junction DNA helicase RuvA